MDADRAYTLDESDDGSFMDRDVPQFDDGRDPIDAGRPRRRLPKVPAPDDAETDDAYAG